MMEKVAMDGCLLIAAFTDERASAGKRAAMDGRFLIFASTDERTSTGSRA
ncbi:hypothetical protein [Frateuria defendens]|nr:hypothetical protein [Frateuria defendens]